MERLWQTDQFVDENTLTVNVNRLRKKLDALGLPDFIVTRFGVGYLWSEPMLFAVFAPAPDGLLAAALCAGILPFASRSMTCRSGRCSILRCCVF